MFDPCIFGTLEGVIGTLEGVIGTLGGSGAGAAPTEDLDGVRDLGETIGQGDTGRPLFDGLGLDLDGGSAQTADQVVVMVAGRAVSIQRFT